MGVALNAAGHGLITLFNGLYTLVTFVIGPVPLLVAVITLGMLRLAQVEMNELDTQSRKPMVPRH